MSFASHFGLVRKAPIKFTGDKLYNIKQIRIHLSGEGFKAQKPH
jgi:hypothetical protein